MHPKHDYVSEVSPILFWFDRDPKKQQFSHPSHITLSEIDVHAIPFNISVLEYVWYMKLIVNKVIVEEASIHDTS